MLKIKVCERDADWDLEEELNQFIKKIEEQNQEVIDIKYSVSHFLNGNDRQVFSFSALVMYDDKKDKVGD